MTRDEYEQKYSKQVNLPIDRIHATGMVAVPCLCGVAGCRGWTMRYALAMRQDEVDELPEPYKSEITALRRRLKLRMGGGKL